MVTTKGTLRKYTAKRKKARTSTTTLVKYQKPNARNQRAQIMRNARDVRKLYKAVLSKRIYCDWQYTGVLKSAIPTAPAPFAITWGCFPLTDFSQWTSVMRQDINVTDSSTTYVRNMSLNFRYNLGGSDYAQYNVFIVTPRKESANNDIPARFAAGNFPVAGEEYIAGVENFNFRLNPAVYKVHFASYRTLTENTLFAGVVAPAGNPMTTFAKGQANVNCSINVRLPITTNSWTSLPYMQQAYSKRYFLLVAITSNSVSGAARTASFTFDQLATTVNST